MASAPARGASDDRPLPTPMPTSTAPESAPRTTDPVAYPSFVSSPAVEAPTSAVSLGSRSRSAFWMTWWFRPRAAYTKTTLGVTLPSLDNKSSATF